MSSLEAYFSQFGEVGFVDVKTKQSQNGRTVYQGCGFVSFRYEAGLQRALGYQGHYFVNREISVRPFVTLPKGLRTKHF